MIYDPEPTTSVEHTLSYEGFLTLASYREAKETHDKTGDCWCKPEHTQSLNNHTAFCVVHKGTK